MGRRRLSTPRRDQHLRAGIVRQGPRMTKTVPDALRDAALTSDDVVLSARAAELGASEWQCRQLAAGSRAVGVPHGVLLVPPARDLLRSRARAAQLLVPDGLLCGPTAARLLGVQGLPFHGPEEPMHLLLPDERTRWQRAGLRLHWTRRPQPESVDCAGLQLTEPGHALLMLQRLVDRRTLLALADSAAHRKLVSDEWLDGQRASEAQGSNEHLWRLVDGRSESPSESKVRLVLHDGGLPAPDLQVQVRDETGRIIARLDLGWREQRVGLEVDSAEHDKPTALYRDRYRQNELSDLGWDIRHVTAWDAANRPAYVRQVVRSALGL